jgi:hypothetical protein
MSSKNPVCEVCETPASGRFGYLGHFTSTGVGERPFLSGNIGEEFRNAGLMPAQPPLLQRFTSIAAESRITPRYGDFRAQIRPELK